MESPPDAESVGLLIKIIGAASAVIVPSWAGWNWLDKRFARKHAVTDSLQTVTNELAIQRGHIGKLFDKLEEHSHRDEEIFRALMKTMGDNHSELMRELGRKADR
jgi:hypothetical protein